MDQLQKENQKWNKEKERRKQNSTEGDSKEEEEETRRKTIRRAVDEDRYEIGESRDEKRTRGGGGSVSSLDFAIMNSTLNG